MNYFKYLESYYLTTFQHIFYNVIEDKEIQKRSWAKMKVTEMKDILYKKLQDEQCNFKKSDINIVKSTSNIYNVTIKDFEHIPFRLEFEIDDFLGYVVYVQYFNGVYYKTIEIFDSKKEYRLQAALIHLGYYIGTRF